jgi:NAD(P)-dependent dehydrogenase (short-subunit alcohol dehydrogenase family)
LPQFTETLFDEICDIHFKGAFFTVQRAPPYLNDGASVILIGTADAAKRGLPQKDGGSARQFRHANWRESSRVLACATPLGTS